MAQVIARGLPLVSGGDIAMAYEPIQKLEVEDYGCIRKASFALSPLHALIGPNDSGKSTALRALRTATQFAAGTFDSDPTTPGPFDPLLDMKKSSGTTMILRYSDGYAYGFRTAKPGQLAIAESVHKGDKELATSGTRSWGEQGMIDESARIQLPAAMADIVNDTERLAAATQAARHSLAKIRDRLTTATMVRFDANALRRRSPLILSDKPIRFADETGEGLASVYQAINSRDVDAFVTIREKVRELFPTVQNILVPTVEGHNVVLQTQLTDGTLVQAAALSEGLLYFLGYAARQYLDESRLFLVEEPETGLHPARISEVMSVLREISKTSQVVIATHSPLVVNELTGDEVSVVTRHPEQGTQVCLLKDVPGFEDAAKVYQPGEFWLSYSDGKTEEPLLNGTPRT